MNYKYLNRISSPSDLKNLGSKEILKLADEIRVFLVDRVTESGGHLASNLGSVELTLALHKVFDSPKDRIIFDVGHQSYTHKIITGRRDEFGTLRTPGGLSGFTSRRESPHDPFGAGHSSTALSAALGFAEADVLSGEKRFTICVIGDGAYTGGMVHEALNNCKSDLPLVIVLNENGMSISKNKGTFAKYISDLRVSGRYLKFKQWVAETLKKIPTVGQPTLNLLTKFKNAVKKVIYKENYFEQLGLYCIGPIDGNDYEKCEKAFSEAKRLGKSVIVHLKTKKGKGYAPAENDPSEYHNLSGTPDSGFNTVCAEEVVKLAKEREEIVSVVAAMGAGTGLDEFGKAYPDRYFDVGIAEPHALTFCAGLAAAGKIPFAAIYSTFLQRGYDSILHDIALQNLPVKILIDRAGLSTSDGATHHGIFDVAFLSHIPNITILSPFCYSGIKESVRRSVDINGPVAIRYSATEESLELRDALNHVDDGVYTDFTADSVPSVVFVTYGSIAEKVILAKKQLLVEGVKSGIIALEQLKPLDGPINTMMKFILAANLIVFVEEGIRRGGVSEAIKSELCGKINANMKVLAVDDNFACPSSECDIYDFVGLSVKNIVNEVKDNLW